MNIGSTAGSSFALPAQAMTQATEQVTGAVQQVVDATTTRPVEESGGVSEGLVDLQQGKQLVAASGKLVEAAQSQIGSLINIQA